MHAIRPDFRRPDPDLVAEFQAFSSPLVSDVLEKNERTLDSGIGPAYRDAFVVGPALTVDAQPGDNLILHKALTLARGGEVLVVDADGHTEAGIWGELMSIAAEERGIAGAVIDGAVRDVSEIEELDYPVFSRGVSPKGSTKRLPGSINRPVSCGGAVIEPGDIVLGDANGVVSVPASDAETVSRLCEEKRASEAERRETREPSPKYEDRFEEILDPLLDDSNAP